MSALRVALVHDELTRRGGAEIVLEELVRLFPQADVYALYAGRPVLTVDGREYRVRTSFLQRFPLLARRHGRWLVPLLPHAAELFDLAAYDLVISSASGLVKGIITRAAIPHLCYCHTPTRYVWERTPYLTRRSRPARVSAGLLMHPLRLFDFAAAQRVDMFLANSVYTQQRIAAYYRRSSTVVYPPIDTAFFTPDPRESLAAKRDSFFLAVGRLTPAKNFEQAIRVCEKLHLPLVVVGDGWHHDRLQRLAHHSVRFAGRVSREQLRSYYRRARALIQPGTEDFGMATAEALSCGTPIVAYDQGGVREIVPNSPPHVLYQEAQEEALAEALRVFLSRPYHFRAADLQRSSFRFSRSQFQAGVQAAVAKCRT